MTLVNIKYVLEGDTLSEDIFKGNSLVIKKNTLLTKQMISKLRQWGFDYVEINQTREEIDISHVNVPDVSDLRMLYFNTLIITGNEYRYGISLHDVQDYVWLENLFVEIMSKPPVYQLVYRLQEWDPYTYRHSFDVFMFGCLLAKRYQVTDIKEFAVGCLLHDVGKLKVPKHILQKPGKLTDDEFKMIRQHTLFGFHELKTRHFSDYIANLAKSHHERADGSGYPEQLKGDQLSEELIILSLVDVYSALTLDRPYRKAFGSAEAERIMVRECKLQDKSYLITFFKMLDIFPLNTIVELNNGTQARIVESNNKTPNYPNLKETLSGKTIKLPLNRSLRVKEVVQFD